jgi:small GTP-binding protein
MADIFISYAREDRLRVEPLAKALEEQGYSVWWDRTIRAGARFDDVIQKALNEASCVLVLWSKASIQSAWVRDEAMEALQQTALIPAYIDPVQAPLNFRRIQGIDLTNWSGRSTDPEIKGLFDAVKVLIAGGIEVTQIQKRTDRAVDYQAELNEESQTINELKVLFVGDGGSGKTSLLKRILQQFERTSWLKRLFHSSFNESEPQTQGIDIDRLTILQNGSEIKLNLWDFGGQEIMHATHQFFLSRRSFYVLVLDGRKEEEPEYWLEMIETLGANSPVLVVMNKIDENPSFDINRKFLKEKYPIIKGYHRLSCKTNVGVKDFITALIQRISQTDHLQSKWPASWYRTKIRLEEINEDYISFGRYEQICRHEGLKDEDKMESLASFLNDLGTVVHFDEPVLRETNVVNPTWITNAVYEIMTSTILAKGKGLLPKARLTEILDEKRYPKHRHDYIIELMKRFELCFSIDPERILVPDLLDAVEPTFNFDSTNALRYNMQYTFFPRSIMVRLIVKLHADIENDLLWRSGCVLHEETFGVRALVRADEREKIVEVFVRGVERREYFAIIRKALLDINLSLRGLQFKERIPCICQDCLSTASPHFYDYSHVLHRKRKGKATIDCERTIEAVSIDDLLAGVESPNFLPQGWDVFISYSSADTEAVKSVVKDLKDRQVRVWWDQEKIKPGDSISKQIEYGLRTSRYIMPCVSRNQISSGWCRAEYAGALNKVLSGYTSQKVIPLILDDLDNADIPFLISDFRCERVSDRKGYRHLMSFLSGR